MFRRERRHGNPRAAAINAVEFLESRRLMASVAGDGGGGGAADGPSGSIVAQSAVVAARDDVVIQGVPPVSAAYVRGSTWAGPDADPSNTTFCEYLGAKGLGDPVYGFRVDNLPGDTTIPWFNVDQIVLECYVQPRPADLPSPDSITVEGQLSKYTVTAVTAVGAEGIGLTLDRPLGMQPAPDPDPTRGDRVKLTVPVFGAPYTFSFAVLQGDADRAPTHRVNAIDLGFARARVNRTANDTATTGAIYTAFADLNADGRINAVDLGAAKARNNDSLPPPPAPASSATTLMTEQRSRPAVGAELLGTK